jgi:hypothetical protein
MGLEIVPNWLPDRSLITENTTANQENPRNLLIYKYFTCNPFKVKDFAGISA